MSIHLEISSAPDTGTLRDAAARYLLGALAWPTMTPERLEDGLAALGIEASVDDLGGGHWAATVAEAHHV